MTQLRRFARSPHALLLALALALAPWRAVAAQRWRDTTDAGPQERALFRIEAEWSRAVIARDAAAIRRVVAPEWVYSDESGTMSREEGVKAFTAGPDTVTQSGNERMRAIVYGNAAVVTGILWMSGRNATGAFRNRYRYTDTFVRINGKWRCIASQDYLIPAGS